MNDDEVDEEALREAAESGEPEAAGVLGWLLLERGERDAAEGWLRKAAEAGETEACLILADLFEDRDEPAEAEVWLRRAAVADTPGAAYSLGHFLWRHGRSDEAEPWWRRASALGDVEATYNLAHLLEDRGEEPEAECLYRQAAEAGSVPSLNNLGALLGERGDLAEAERWYRRGAEEGDMTAAFNLAQYLERRGEVREAERWWLRAALAGHEDAELELARVFESYSERVVEVLQDAGADLSQPRLVEHYLHLPSEEAARRVAREVDEHGYRVALNPPLETGDEWLVLVTEEAIIDAKTFSVARAFLARAAAREKVSTTAGKPRHDRESRFLPRRRASSTRTADLENAPVARRYDPLVRSLRYSRVAWSSAPEDYAGSGPRRPLRRRAHYLVQVHDAGK